jgi:hypothetical protein
MEAYLKQEIKPETKKDITLKSMLLKNVEEEKKSGRPTVPRRQFGWWFYFSPWVAFSSESISNQVFI